MVFILTSPAGVAGGCLSCNWHATDSIVCPDTLWIQFICGIAGLYPHTVSVDFAGRGKIGGYCGGSDTYVTFNNNPQTASAPTDVYVDIWAAYRAGVWTSSTTIKFYAEKNNAVVLSRYLVIPRNYTGTVLDVTGSIPDLDTGTCPPTLLKTINVFDDGTYS